MNFKNKLLKSALFALLPLCLTACQDESSYGNYTIDLINAVPAQAGELTTQGKPFYAWSISAVSKNKSFEGELQCEATPFVGGFQQCQLKLNKSGKPVEGASIAIDGGMKAHGHGLPTQPKLTPVDGQSGHYQIEGLKFSMPGAWTLGFLIKSKELNDQLVFDFSI